MKSYARLAGVLFVVSMIGGGFGELYAPTMLIVSGNALATANNVHAHPFLFHLGFALYLVEAVCDVTLAWLFNILLKPAHRHLALLAAFFGLISTATFAGTELFYFAPSFILDGSHYLKTFTPDQLQSLALLSFKFYGVGGGIFMAFYGIAWMLRGFLIYRSTYFPKWLGALAALAGFGFIAHNLALVLAPAVASDLMMLPMFVLGVALTGWLLIKGIDVARWETRTAHGRN